MISVGRIRNYESEAEYIRNFKPSKSKYKTNDSTPEEILSKYNLKDMSDKDYHQMINDLNSSNNAESSYLGSNMLLDELSEELLAHFNGQPEQIKEHYNCLQSVAEDYKTELSAGDAKGADYYRKLYQFMSETSAS